MSTSRRAKGEGTIFPRGEAWVGRLTYEDPVTGLVKRVQVTEATKTKAAVALRAIRDRVTAGAPARDDSMMFGAFAQRWIETTLEASDRKNSTKMLYAGLTRTHIVGSDLGRLPMSKVRPTTVERFVLGLRKFGQG